MPPAMTLYSLLLSLVKTVTNYCLSNYSDNSTDPFFLSVAKVFEQFVNLKFYTKLGKSTNKTLDTLRAAYNEVTMNKFAVFEWRKMFKNGGKT